MVLLLDHNALNPRYIGNKPRSPIHEFGIIKDIPFKKQFIYLNTHCLNIKY